MFNVRKNSRDTANPPLLEREEEKDEYSSVRSVCNSIHYALRNY